MNLLPAPRIRGNHKVTRTPAVIHLYAWCPPGGYRPDPSPEKPIIVTTAYGSEKLDGYDDIGAALARMMQVPVTIIERTNVEDWRLTA